MGGSTVLPPAGLRRISASRRCFASLSHSAAFPFRGIISKADAFSWASSWASKATEAATKIEAARGHADAEEDAKGKHGLDETDEARTCQPYCVTQ